MKYLSTKKQIRLIILCIVYYILVILVGVALGSVNHNAKTGLYIGLLCGGVVLLPVIVYYVFTLVRFLLLAKKQEPQTAVIAGARPCPAWKRMAALNFFDGDKLLSTQYIFLATEISEMTGKTVQYIRRDSVIFILNTENRF